MPLSKPQNLMSHCMTKDQFFLTPGFICRLAGLVILFFFVTYTPVSAREKTDEVRLKNGDTIKGEIKSLDRGKLKFKTDDMGTIYIEWNKIETIQSDYTFEVELMGGQKYFGTLVKTGKTEQVGVAGVTVTSTFPHHVIVRITSLKATFWERIQGSLDLGFGMEQAKDRMEMTLGFEMSLRSRNYMRKLTIDSYILDENDSEQTRRTSALFNFTRFLGRKQFLTGMASYEQNDELGLEFRWLIGGAYGYHFVQTNTAMFQALFGFDVNREEFSGTEEGLVNPFQTDNQETRENNLEALLGFSFEKFRYDDPELSMTANLSVFPGLTEWGRVRIKFDGKLKYELFNNFYVGLSVFDAYDSDPPVSGVVKNDYGGSLSIGWSFNN